MSAARPGSFDRSESLGFSLLPESLPVPMFLLPPDLAASDRLLWSKWGSSKNPLEKFCAEVELEDCIWVIPFDEELTWSFFRWFSRDTGSSCYTIPYGGIDLTFGCYTIAIQYNLELTAFILVPGQCHFPTIDRLLLRWVLQRSFNFSSALIYCFTVLAHESPFLWRELYTKFVCLFCNNLAFFFLMWLRKTCNGDYSNWSKKKLIWL